MAIALLVVRACLYNRQFNNISSCNFVYDSLLWISASTKSWSDFLKKCDLYGFIGFSGAYLQEEEWFLKLLAVSLEACIRKTLANFQGSPMTISTGFLNFFGLLRQRSRISPSDKIWKKNCLVALGARALVTSCVKTWEEQSKFLVRRPAKHRMYRVHTSMNQRLAFHGRCARNGGR